MSRKLESEKFQRAFDAYFWKWWMVIGILYFIAFSLYTILIFKDIAAYIITKNCKEKKAILTVENTWRNRAAGNLITSEGNLSYT